jgi:sugar phosphate permease
MPLPGGTMNNHKLFYGWFIVLVAMLAISASAAPFVFASMGLFILPLNEEFGWSRAQISALFPILTVTYMFSQPIAGRLIDRLGTRTVLIPSTIAFGLGLAAIPLVVSELWHFAAMFIFIATAGVAANTMAYLRTISAWFNKRRGLAIGLSISGIGLGYAYVPVLVQTMISNYGWRSGYYALGAIVLFIIVPAISLVLKESPATMGLLPDGAYKSESESESTRYGHPSSVAIKKLEFWLISIVFLCIAFVLHGILLHLVPLLRDKGFDADTASYVAAIMGATVFVSRIFIGWLIDHFFAPSVALIFFAVSAIGFLVLSLSSNLVLMYLAAFMIGLSLGAEVDLLAYLCGKYFGLSSFAEIFALLFISVLMGSALGSVAFGYGFDSMGSYAEVLVFSAILNTVALLIITRLGPYPDVKDFPSSD